MRLLPVRSITTILFIAAVGLFVAMWFYTNQLNQGAFVPNNDQPSNNARIVEVAGERIRLASLHGKDGMWNRDGLYGLQWDGGYARVGRIIDVHPDSVRRELILLGAPPPEGIEARLDTFVYRGDPQVSLGIPFEEISIAGPMGEGPAWYIPGSGATWAIFIHGKGASREESLRVLPTLYGLGLPTLVITYRNDPEYTRIDDGRYGYGETEWQDVAAAMDVARQHGAEQFILIGNSMGGGISMATALRTEVSGIAGLVLDAPMLSLKRTVEFRASERGIPAIFTRATLQFATWRDGTDWSKMDFLTAAASLTAPILLFHGDADDSVPVHTSDALAAARPDLVTYWRLSGAGHVQSWNQNRELYDLQLREFLQRITGP